MNPASKLKVSSLVATVVASVAVSLFQWQGGLLPSVRTGINNLAEVVFSQQGPEELPLKDMFVIYLVLFVMIGLIPLLEKIIAKFQHYFSVHGKEDASGHVLRQKSLDLNYVEPAAEIELYDFEVIILRLIAQAGWKGLTLTAIADSLHLEPPFVKKTLMALHSGSLITFLDLPIIGRTYCLSKKGREYSKRQGFLVSL